MDYTEKDIFEFIKEQNELNNQAVSCKQIRDHFDMNHIRRVTEAIRSLRIKGFKISSSSKGYSVNDVKLDIKKIQRTSDSIIETLIISGGLDALEHIKRTIFRLEKEIHPKEERKTHPQQQTIYDMGVSL